MDHLGYAILFFLAAQACILWNNWLMVEMIKAINIHRSADQQINTAYRNRAKSHLIRDEYRHFYPQSRRETWRAVSLYLGFTFFLLTAIAFFR